MINLKLITASARKSLKSLGIKAKCKMDVSCGSDTVRIDVPAYGVEFTNEEQYAIKNIALSQGFTWVKGLKINLKENTNPFNFVFYV